MRCCFTAYDYSNILTIHSISAIVKVQGIKINTMQNDQSDAPINYHDDNRVLRYVLRTVKGASPVSGGVLGEALESEYESAEQEARTGQELDFEADI